MRRGKKPKHLYTKEFSFVMDGKRYRLRSKLRLFVAIAGLVATIALVVTGIQGINHAVTGIYHSIDNLDTRQSELESSIDTLTEELQQQKEISSQIVTLLEKQNGINTFDENTRAYYGMSDRSLGLIPRETVLENQVATMNIQHVSLSHRLASVESKQNAQIQQQNAVINDFSSFYARATGDTDLCGYVNINEAEFNKFIAKKAPKDSPFIGRADVFLKASEITGLDPRYILAHAALESKWGKSNFAINRSNYFGIRAYDSNPNMAKYMGTDLESGIVNGAKWIKEKYYDKGRTTLNKMKAAGYATDPKWVGKILDNMN